MTSGHRASTGSDSAATTRGVKSPRNIVWFLVDSIRHYPTEVDLRGKLPVMERFGKESVEFTRCVTTAPSTIMSVTAMMTGLPAYCLARNYDEFRFDSRAFPCLSEVLKKHGYSSHAFLRGPQTREKFKNLLDMVPRRYWPEDLRHSQKWENADLNRLLEAVLADGISRPAFLFFHYNPQTRSEAGEILSDPDVSEKVEWAWSRLEDAGFRRDNTIFVLCSDHGFPDPSTGMTSDWEKRHRLTHDLVLTDDNILIPLYIGCPSLPPLQIDTPVSSLDLFPTLVDLLGLPEAEDIEAGTDGRSLVPLMESGDAEPYRDRLFRADSRLMLQTGRSTAIRGKRYKYIRYHDEHRVAPSGELTSVSEVLVDLENDPSEERNLLTFEEGLDVSQREAWQKLRREFERTEERAVQYQVEYLLTRQSDTLLEAAKKQGDEGKGPDRVLLISEPGTSGLLPIGSAALRRLLGDAEVDVLAGTSHSSAVRDAGPEADGEAGRVSEYTVDSDSADLSLDSSKLLRGRDYGLVVVLLEDPSRSSPVIDELLRFARVAGTTQPVVLDCNFDTHRSSRYWYFRMRALLESIPYIIEEPTLLFSKLKTGLRLVARRILKRMGRWERWDSTDDTGR